MDLKRDITLTRWGGGILDASLADSVMIAIIYLWLHSLYCSTSLSLFLTSRTTSIPPPLPLTPTPPHPRVHCQCHILHYLPSPSTTTTATTTPLPIPPLQFRHADTLNTLGDKSLSAFAHYYISYTILTLATTTTPAPHLHHHYHTGNTRLTKHLTAPPSRHHRPLATTRSSQYLADLSSTHARTCPLITHEAQGMGGTEGVPTFSNSAVSHKYKGLNLRPRDIQRRLEKKSTI